MLSTLWMVHTLSGNFRFFERLKFFKATDTFEHHAGWSTGWMNTILAPSDKRKYHLVPDYRTLCPWVMRPR